MSTSGKSQAERALPPPCHVTLTFEQKQQQQKLLTTIKTACAQCKGTTSVATLSYSQIATHALAAVTGVGGRECHSGSKKGEEEVQAKERRRQNPVFGRSVPAEKVISHPQQGAGELQKQGSMLFMTPASNRRAIRTLIRRDNVLHGDLKL